MLDYAREADIDPGDTAAMAALELDLMFGVYPARARLAGFMDAVAKARAGSAQAPGAEKTDKGNAAVAAFRRPAPSPSPSPGSRYPAFFRRPPLQKSRRGITVILYRRHAARQTSEAGAAPTSTACAEQTRARSANQATPKGEHAMVVRWINKDGTGGFFTGPFT